MFRVFLLIVISMTFLGTDTYAQANSSAVLFDDVALLKHIKSLSSDAFEGRKTGTRGALKARKYIINQFHTLKVKPLAKSFEQPFLCTKNKKVFNAVNVLGVIEGTEFPKKYIVISAHYDHEGILKGKIYNGADDNASGVSALFAFAEYFKENPPKHSVILAAFDAEEIGLQGSKYFVNHPVIPLKNIRINLNMDMISRSNKKELFIVGASNNKVLKNLILSSAQESQINLVIGHDGFDVLENWTYASDHANFHKKNIPFLYFGVEDHKDYHESTDDYENIHPQFYIEAVKGILSVFNKIDGLDKF